MLARKIKLSIRLTDYHGRDLEYQVANSTEKRTEIETTDSLFSEIYAGSLIAEVVKFLDAHGVDGLKSLCCAIESLGEVATDDGEATVWMGPLYDPACDYHRNPQATQ